MNLALEIFGDKWTLLIIRDILIEGKRHFREFLASDESISTNILADRLLQLERNGILTHKPDPSHKQKKVYCLTTKGIELFPVLLAIAKWSCDHLAVDKKSAEHARMLIKGGEPLQQKIMDDMRDLHLKPIK
ncbi:MAG: helix-turn-helix domain-containing protein [Bacteroidota bacterium]